MGLGFPHANYSAGPAVAPVQALRLDPIKLTDITYGGYHLVWRGRPPQTAQVLLCLGNTRTLDDRSYFAAHQLTRAPLWMAGSDVGFLDVTGGYNRSLLPHLLRIFAGLQSWGKTIACRAAVVQDGRFVPGSFSGTENLDCPVQPLDTPVTFASIGMAFPRLTYPGNGFGRLLSAPIAGKRYFLQPTARMQNGPFETDNNMRGFDCTTFPMSLFNCYPNMTGKYGTALADALGAAKCDLEQKHPDEVKKYFADKTQSAGLYFMWSEGHVLLVKDGMVHEFTYGGYQVTDIQQRPLNVPRNLLWVRKLPDYGV